MLVLLVAHTFAGLELTVDFDGVDVEDGVVFVEVDHHGAFLLRLCLALGDKDGDGAVPTCCRGSFYLCTWHQCCTAEDVTFGAADCLESR